ncbi:thioesterase family protein [Aspergillus ellipticus CBS 707.79]|uniref:Thioesterase family protein n=1 Tax=Aspergillus ellipticus CBS 707.79 TaxID=1448320 RepID=A0A319D743_9EURO|nr:thioesterase family protein [Aspergillus ellipticus CBS 707.79]
MSLPRTTSKTLLTRMGLTMSQPSSTSLQSLSKNRSLQINLQHTQHRTIQAAASTQAIESKTTPPSYQTPSPLPPSSPKTPEVLISALPLVQSLRQNPSQYRESRPHLSMTPSLRPSHFVAGTLAGPEKVSVAPYMFTSIVNNSTPTKGEEEARPRAQVISVFHIGEQMCGHPGYVHGGLLSVMFDEAFARCVSDSFPSGLGMTANLNVDFRKPAIPDRVYVMKAETVKVEGRKAWVEGVMKSMPSDAVAGEKETVVAEARALFVEPKFAESMVPLYRG